MVLFKKDYFTNQEFLKYLKHLLYFEKRKFRVYLIYPQCIPILKKLLKEDILKRLEEEDFYKQLQSTQYFNWVHKIDNLLKKKNMG